MNKLSCVSQCVTHELFLSLTLADLGGKTSAIIMSMMQTLLLILSLCFWGCNGNVRTTPRVHLSYKGEKCGNPPHIFQNKQAHISIYLFFSD